MSTKTNRWIFALSTIFLVLFFMMLGMPAQVSAAQETGSNANSCLTCHEDLYYLHDSGKWYCLAVHTDRCVNCHEGNAAVMKMEESHLGLITHPQEDNGAKCQECHTPADTESRLVEFASAGGFDTAIRANTYMPLREASSGFPDTQQTNPLLENLPWLVGALVLFGLWLMLALFSPQKP
jgi:hypothetical protein